MRNKDAFSGYHPTINFLYYALVLLFSMCLMHPVYLAISLTGALAYDIYLKGRKAVRFAVMGLLPMAALAALVNPAFNHEGQTILTYLPGGNPLTLESMLYGVAAAVMLASVVLWFSSYNEVMTSDKFVYLFGRVIPALSLVLSMALRFIPKFRAQMQTVSEAQACIGRDTKNGSVFRRVGNAVKIFSIMVTWSLENAIETADSMRARGYGLPGRTAFSIYRFDDRDKAALAWLIFCGAYLLSGWMAGGTYFRYYPTVKTALWTPLTISFMCVYLALVLTPVIVTTLGELSHTRQTIVTMTRHMERLLPMLLTLLTALGGSASSAFLHPMVAAASGSMVFLAREVILRLVMCTCAVTAVNHLSDRADLTRMAQLLRGAVCWLLGVSFTVFLGAMSLQGVTSASIDGVAIRAAKYAVDNFVPVVGGMFSDTMDTLVGCTLIVKNALGVAAVLVLVGALVGPLLRTLAVVFMLRLSAALLEPMAQTISGIFQGRSCCFSSPCCAWERCISC